eukprot:gene38080-61512_t
MQLPHHCTVRSPAMQSKSLIAATLAALFVSQAAVAAERLAADLALSGAMIVDVPAGTL